MGVYETLFGSDETETLEENKARIEKEIAPAFDTFMGGSAEDWQKEAEKFYDPKVPPKEITWKDVGNVALDFTPIIGDIKGGYETVQFIGDELDKENPNYYLIGALGGLGAVATIVGLVPGIGDAAQKAIMSGARMAADRANKLVDSLPEYDPNTVGSNLGNMFASTATKDELDPIRLAGSSKGFYKNKAPNYVPDIEVQSTDQGLLMPKRSLKIDDLQGSQLMALVADRTDAGKVITGIRGGARDYDFEVPVELQGGRGFMRYPDTGSFASLESEMQKTANKAAELGADGTPVKGVFMSMSPEGSDFSTMMSDTVIEMMKQSPIKKKDMKELTKWVKTNLDPEFIGFDNLDAAKDYLKQNMVGTKRSLIWKELDKTDYVDKGFPTMGDARVAITEDALRTSPLLQGTSVANIDSSGNLISGPVRIHETYSGQTGPTGAAGYAGDLEPIPYEILMRKFIDRRRQKGQRKAEDFRSLQMSQFGEEVDQQMVDEVNTYLDLIEDAERDAYVKSLPDRRERTQTILFGDNGGPPLNDPPITSQMEAAFADPLEIGTNPLAQEGAFLKSYTSEDVQMLEQLSENATAGTTKANSLINAPVEEGTKIGIRLNLNSNIPNAPQGANKLQTLHKGNFNGTPLSYQTTATVKNVKFNVSQSGRRDIASKKYAPDTPEAKNKFPAMSVDGNYVPNRNVLDEMDDTVVEIGTNPMNLHLFVDMATGQAVESAEIATVFGDRVYAKGVKYMKQADAPKPKDASDGTVLPSEVRYKFNRGGTVWTH